MISRILMVMLLGSFTAAAYGVSAKPGGGDAVQVQDVQLTIPADWSLHQNARDRGQMILGFKNNDQYLRLYVVPRTDLVADEIFLNHGAELLTRQATSTFSLPWQRMHTRFTGRDGVRYIAAFFLKHEGYTYYGFSTGESIARADESVNLFLSQMN